jgi:putative ABC transport system permease protein
MVGVWLRSWRRKPLLPAQYALTIAVGMGAVAAVVSLMLALGVGLVFLLGCANLAILMVAEGGRRRRQIAIRAALGASRWRLWGEVAAEQGLLTLFSLGLGVALASSLLRALARLVPAAGIGPPLPHPPRLNVAALLGSATFALAVALAWSALLVAAADWRGTARALAADTGLGCAGLSHSDRGAARWRLVSLAAQAGIGICLLAAAVLATRTYATLSAANLGPEPRRTVLLSVSPRDGVVLNDAQTAAFNEEVLSRFARLPGTRAIGLAEPCGRIVATPEVGGLHHRYERRAA